MLTELLNKLKELLLWVPKKFFEWILDLLASIFEAIPVPEFFKAASANLSAIPPEVAFFVEPMQLGYGLTVIFAAYILRFIIRRLPVVG